MSLKKMAGAMFKRWIEWFWATPRRQDKPAATRPILARTPFGKEREVQLIGSRGLLAIAQTCDDGPMQVFAVRRANVHRGDVDVFDAFMARERKKAEA